MSDRKKCLFVPEKTETKRLPVFVFCKERYTNAHLFRGFLMANVYRQPKAISEEEFIFNKFLIKKSKICFGLFALNY